MNKPEGKKTTIRRYLVMDLNRYMIQHKNKNVTLSLKIDVDCHLCCVTISSVTLIILNIIFLHRIMVSVFCTNCCGINSVTKQTFPLLSSLSLDAFLNKPGFIKKISRA